jgi:hypothetical protein
MKIDGVAVNHKWAAGLTQDAFVKEFSGPGYAHLWPDVKDRKAKLKEVHALCKEKVAGKATTDQPAAEQS